MLEAFRTLKKGVIDLVCEQTGHALQPPKDADQPAQNDLESLAMVIDGVAVAMVYNADYKKDCAFVFTEFGRVPADQELVILRKLLDVNFLLYRGGAPTFTRDPASGNIMLLSEVPLAQATPAMTLHYLRQLVSQALQWRNDHYLEDDGASLLDEHKVIA